MSDYVMQRSRLPGRTEVSVLSLLANPPVGWKAAPHYAVFRRVRRVGYEDLPLLSVYRDLGIVPREGRDDNHNRPSEDLSNYQRVNKGDLVINKMKAWQGSVGVSDYQGLVSPAYFVFEPVGRNHGRFLHHLLRSDVYTAAYGAISKGIRVDQWDLDPQEHSRLPVLLPPIEEQRRIAAFLDHETARIDELVREQERLLSLLEARETARITEVVTRGLNDGVGLKESGHQALGDIPANWEVVRLKHLLRAPLTYGANEAAVEDDPTLPRYIRITDIDGQGNLRDETFRSLPWEVAAPYLLEDGDLLLARSGATVGKSFLYRDRVGPACFAGYMIRARFDPSSLLPEYAEAYMKSRPYWDYIRESNIQATIQNVSAEKYGNCPVPVPPLEEQIAILGKLADESKSSRQLRVQASRSIDYLLERRSALISAAVTGQLDLSDWRPPNIEAVAEVA